VITVINLRVPSQPENSLTGFATVNFSIRTLLHRDSYKVIFWIRALEFGELV
jgi:uncharacterized membrane protein